MMDAVDRQTELSDRQRAIIKGLAHGMLNDTQKRVLERFKSPENGQQEAADEDL